MSWPILEPIAIDVALAENGFSAAERSLLESRIADEASRLIQDLRLPAVAQVKLVDRSVDDRERSVSMVVTIEGHRCRQPVLPTYDWQNSLNGLAGFAGSVLYANRRLLLTERVLRAVATARPAHVVGLIPEMIRGGFSLEVAETVAGRVISNVDAESRRYQVELLLGDFVPPTLTVETGAELHRQVTVPTTEQFSQMVRMMIDGLFYELGVKFPPVRLVANEALADFDFRVQIASLRGPILRGLRADEFLVNATASDLDGTLKIHARPSRNPATGLEGAVVTGNGAASRCEQEMRLTTWDAAGYAVLAIAHALRTNAALFLTASAVQSMLARLSDAFPLLIVNVLERFPPRFVLDVLRALVCEGFSIRDLRGVCEAMHALNGVISHVADDEIAVLPPSASLPSSESGLGRHQTAKHCADNVRMVMKRYVTTQFAKRGDATVLELAKPVEARLRGCQGPIRGQEHRSLVGAIAAASMAGCLSKSLDSRSSKPLVLLTAFDLRRRVREAIETEFPYVAVVCREELEDGIAWRDHRLIYP